MVFWFALKGDGTFSLGVVAVSRCQSELEEPHVQMRERTVGYFSRRDAWPFCGSHNKEVLGLLGSLQTSVYPPLNSPALIARLVAAHAVETWATLGWTP